MDQKQFLAAIVPWEAGSYVNIGWRRPDHKWDGRFCPSLDTAIRVLADLVPGKNDVYVCLSSQKEVLKQRKGSNALALKCTWADIDINTVPKGHEKYNPNKYDTVEEAITEVYLFCQKAKIPNPSLIVLTGGGIHVYWLSGHVLTVAEWRKYANALKTAIKIHGLKADAGLTSDVVRLLRIIGFRNNKYDPAPTVRIFRQGSNGALHDFSVIFADLLILQPPEAAKGEPLPEIEMSPAFRHLDPNAQPLGEGIPGYDTRPIPFEPIRKGCAFFREAYETGGKNYANPLWHLSVYGATFMENGYELAHQFSNQHSSYSPEETDQLWHRKIRERGDPRLGWPRCRTIQGNGCTACDSCPHLIEDKSPLRLGWTPPPQPEAAFIEEDEELLALGGHRPSHLRLPQGFCESIERKQICAIFYPVEKGKTVVPGRLLPLFNGQFSNIGLYEHDGFQGLSFTSTVDRGGSVDIFMPVGICCDKPKLYTFMSSKNVGHIADTEVENMGAKFMSSWLELLQREDTAVREQGVMGWQYDQDGKRHGFAYGGKMHKVDGTTVPLRVIVNDDFHTWYRPTGKKEVWLQAAKLLTDRKQPELDIIMAIAFAAPLTAFAGALYGAILSVWGDPGTSKSTAQQVAAAVWGHPKQTRESLTSTPKSVQGRLGRTRNLPAYWDDVQDERHQEALFSTMFVASEGAEGGRLNPDASYKARLEWQTLLVACSNASFVDYLTKKQKSTTAGIRRVFEVEFRKRADDTGMIDAHDASRTFAALEHNYGVIGSEYAALIAREHEQIEALMAATTRRFSKMVSGAGDESFWLGICSTLIVGATLARKLGAELDVAAMEEHLAHAFIHNRAIRRDEGSEAGTYANTERSLTEFLNTYIRKNAMFVDKNFVYRRESIHVIEKPQNGSPIYIQISRDERIITISKKAMRDYFWENNIQPKPVFEGMKKWFKAKEARIILGGGTPYGQSQEWCYQITVPIGELTFLEEIVTARGHAI